MYPGMLFLKDLIDLPGDLPWVFPLADVLVHQFQALSVCLPVGRILMERAVETPRGNVRGIIPGSQATHPDAEFPEFHSVCFCGQFQGPLGRRVDTPEGKSHIASNGGDI